MSNVPIATKETLIYSQRKNNTYKSEDQIDIYIPPSLQVLNTKECYIVANLKMSGKLKAFPGMRAGAYSLIRSIQIMTGDSSTILETLDNYAIMQAMHYYYSQTDSVNNLRVLHEGKPSSDTIKDGVANQYIDPAEGNLADKCFNNVEVVLPIYLSGCLRPDRLKVFPNVATKGLRIQIQLNNAESALQVLKAQMYSYNVSTGLNEVVEPSETEHGGYEQATGFYIQQVGDDANGYVYLGNTDDLLENGGNALAGKYALTNVADEPGHPFFVGQTVKTYNADESETFTFTINQVDHANNRVKLVFDQELAENQTNVRVGDRLWIDITASGTDTDFALSNVRMNISYVESEDPKKPLTGDYAKEMRSGGMNFSILTYTDYAVNISASSMNNSLYLNCRNSRAKSILSVPQKSHANDLAEDSFKPDRQKPKDYQYILYSVLTPDRRVQLNRYNLDSYNAIALREQMLALTASKIPLNSVKKPADHFFIGRRLALDGYTYNTNKEGEIRLNLNFEEISTGVLMHNFVVHLRKIRISENAVDVIY